MPSPAAEPPMDRPLAHTFTANEADLLEHLLEVSARVETEWSRELRQALEAGIPRLSLLAQTWESYPPLREAARLGTRHFTAETLANTLMERGEHGIEWALPTKAVLSRTFGIAKVNFWSSLLYALADQTDPDALELIEPLSGAIEEAVYTRLAEELYGTFASSTSTDRELRMAAVHAAVELWDGRLTLVTDRFCPILRSAWAARTRNARQFGTLVGASEVFGLLFQGADAEFLDVFREGHDADQLVPALEEFLFDLDHEELERVRTSMQERGLRCVTADEVADILGLSADRFNAPMDGPKALYSSFRRRRLRARHRAAMGAPGPRRTAESFVLEALLRRRD